MKITWNYVAGFTDGEGSIGICGRGTRITWGQKTPEVLDAIQKFLEARGYRCNSYSVAPKLPRRPNRIYMLNMCWRADCERFARRIYPLVIVKRESCERLFQWLEDHPKLKNVQPIDIAEVRQLIAEDMTVIEAAKRLNRGRKTLDEFCRRNGLHFRDGRFKLAA